MPSFFICICHRNSWLSSMLCARSQLAIPSTIASVTPPFVPWRVFSLGAHNTSQYWDVAYGSVPKILARTHRKDGIEPSLVLNWLPMSTFSPKPSTSLDRSGPGSLSSAAADIFFSRPSLSCSTSSTLCAMATILPVPIVFVIIASLMTASFLFVPKGPHQVYVAASHLNQNSTRWLEFFQHQDYTNCVDANVRCLLLAVDDNIYGSTTSSHM